jgi:KUP system potassium uptake protein
LMLACIGLVLGFQTSSRLAAAYGVAVTTTMVVTSILFLILARERWKWSVPAVTLLGGIFLTIDLAFFGANLLKIPHGGWVPLVIGGLVFTLLTTWKKGRLILARRMKQRTLPLDLFVRDILERPPLRVPGTAVYMYSNPGGTPPALLHNLKHNKVLHERVVFLSIATDEVSYVSMADRSDVKLITTGIYQVILHYGFMEDADIPAALSEIGHAELEFKPMSTSYFLGRETLIASNRAGGMARWRENLFAMMAQNARSASSFFKLPPNQVVELGAQIEI